MNLLTFEGKGTWQSKPGEVQTAVSYALQNGYKLIDGAYCYGNEDEVGEGLKEAFAKGIKREDIFIVSKVWATYNSRVAEGLEKSLKSLGLDYVDLYLIHWPLLMNPNGELAFAVSRGIAMLITCDRQPRQVPHARGRLARHYPRL